MRLLCKLGWHEWRLSPSGMRRMCEKCSRFEENINPADEPNEKWVAREIEELAVPWGTKSN